MAKPKARKHLKVTLVRSPKDSKPDIEATVKALGLRRLHQSVVRPNNPAVRGMVKKTIHLLQVEEIDG